MRSNTMPTVYEIVTQTIIEKLEAGEIPWRRPWVTSAPKNLVSGKEYRGINTFMLGVSGFPRPEWLTFNQAAKLGATVRAGERSNMVVYFNVGEERLNAKTGKLSKPFLLRYSRVFNISQCNHGEQTLTAKLGLDATKSAPVPSIEACDAIVCGMPNRPHVKASDRAWYRPSTDEVGMPDKSTFHSSEGFYATLFHELTHSTAHPSRVGRPEVMESQAFGSATYSREELIAEMGAAMLCGVAGVSPATVENSAAYLRSWISALRGDSKLVVAAASGAQKAADYIRGIVAKSSSESETVEA
jgi:antirestriction protein ArdC